MWDSCKEELVKYAEYIQYVEMFGLRKAKLLFNKKITQLRQDYITKRKADLLRRIPGLLEEFFPTLNIIDGRLVTSIHYRKPETSQRFDYPARLILYSPKCRRDHTNFSTTKS